MSLAPTVPGTRARPAAMAAGRSSLARLMLPWLVPALGVLAWQAAADLGWLQERFLPSPLSVARAAVRLGVSGELARHIGVSSRRAAIGFALGGWY
jgi:sulfonate transport system permease protein